VLTRQIASAADPWDRRKSTMAVSGKQLFGSNETRSAVKMVKKTGEVFVQKPSDDVPKIFTFDSVYDWK
jgi:hypothetical protein